MVLFIRTFLDYFLTCWVVLNLHKGTFVGGAVLQNESTVIQCEYYNSTCKEKNGCQDVEICHIDDQKHHCYVLWSVGENGTFTVKLKGCFLNGVDCVNQTRCVDTTLVPKNSLLFCCCERNMCNSDFSWEPKPTEAAPPSTSIPIREAAGYNFYHSIWIGLAVGILALSLGAAYYWTRRNKHYFHGWGVSGYYLFKLPTSEPHPLPPSTPILDNRPINLIEIKARGRFGAVWKAQFKGEDVAVKIFPIQDKQSWLTEQDIFKLPHMDHPNILQYIGVEKHGDNLQTEFWLITAYHERGSLCDFLKAHTLTWSELCRVAETMSKGLMRLHEAIPGRIPGEVSKPAIAHRDFKSKNVLLKSDLTACIADFGLAITFEAGKSCGDTHGQVGTRRYMAPEVLEGAINFTQDAFLRIDMYACGLVLWELVSRCTAQDGPIPEYRLPFEEEVGQHPSLEDMQESVVQQKVRPLIQEHWKHHPGLSVICDTMEECWDHDAEARLSASCVMERIISQAKYQQQSMGWRIENEAPLNILKENSM
ncbi:activin receptor type-2A isoform X1 [Diorhabda sublineata]|uniref:activin receptor type-2A isoform X1 n=1 Tax=Diorhabda sublineata TaxID=1163346 RepID=UPI0024E16F91|nr:activin receptor type-2A isoform X1 [Diorhabda sublineata]XP_056648684.1 activin receptor type-2A isoform X1 [Diorhabda sublineata]